MVQQKKYRDVFCYRLNQARLSKGLSQKTLGVLAGIDEFVASARINRYEKGVHEADIGTAQRLACVLQVPLAYFYAEDDCLAEIIAGFNKLPDSIRQTINKLVQENMN